MATLGCRPVELDPADPGDARILSMTFVYDGSVKRRCEACDCEVWLGPRQQEVEGTLLCDGIVCFRCAAVAAARGAVVPHHLGNRQPNPSGETAPKGHKVDGSWCGCRCHSVPGVRHMVACCGPPYDEESRG